MAQKKKENWKTLFFSEHEGNQRQSMTDAVCSDADKARERECGRWWNKQKGQGDPASGWEICEWEVLGHVYQ